AGAGRAGQGRRLGARPHRRPRHRGGGRRPRRARRAGPGPLDLRHARAHPEAMRAAWLARLDAAAWLREARSRLRAEGHVALHAIADAAAPLAAALLAEGDDERPSLPLLLVVPRERDVEG